MTCDGSRRARGSGPGARGRLETIEYDSGTVGGKRKARVYTPPGYDDGPDKRYPSVYVIQGYTGQVTMWQNREPFRQPFRRPSGCLGSIVAFTHGGGEYALPGAKKSQAFSLKKRMHLSWNLHFLRYPNS